MNIFGVDFSSSPSRRKPIVIACARLSASLRHSNQWVLSLECFEKVHSLDGFADWLKTPGPWLSGFDFPFALPVPMTASLRTVQTLCLEDASGDHLDAWLCAIQASVGYLCEEREPGSLYGMGAMDPLEGWIVSVARDDLHYKKYRA